MCRCHVATLPGTQQCFAVPQPKKWIAPLLTCLPAPRAAVLERFPDGCDYSFLWQRLLTAVAPFLPRIPAEVRTLNPTL